MADEEHEEKDEQEEEDSSYQRMFTGIAEDVKNRISTVLNEYQLEESLEDQNVRINNIVDEIKNSCTVEESMFSLTPQFKNTVRSWKEKETNLNLLQLAVIYGNEQNVINLKTKYVFEHSKKPKCFVECFPWEKNFHTMKTKSNNGFYETFVDVNAPLHLACKLGHLEIMKLFLPSHNSIETHDVNNILTHRSYLKLDSIKAVHGHLFPESPVCDTDTFPDTLPVQDQDDQMPQDIDDGRIKDEEREDDNDSIYMNVPSSSQQAKTPFDICVEERHLDCCIYVAKLIFRYKIRRNLYFRSFYYGKEGYKPRPGNALHIACHIKNPDYLDLLLSEEYYREEIESEDPYHKPPLWIALADSQCVNCLIMNGADARVIVDNQSLLQCLFSKKDWFNDKEKGSDMYETARALIEGGADVNYESPGEETTALELVLQSFGKKRGLVKEYKSDNLQDCITLLLQNGANTSIKLGNAFDHTVAHTFFESDFFTNSFVVAMNFDVVYSVLSLLLEEGCLDVNAGSDEKYSILVSYILEYEWVLSLPMDKQRTFLNLFFINGANFNQSSRPDYVMDDASMYYDVMGWREVPLVLAFYRNFHLVFQWNILDFMDITSVNRSWARLENLKSLENEDLLDKLIKNYNPMRTLAHMSKLKVVACVGKQGKRKMKSLPIPEILQMYLVCNTF